MKVFYLFILISLFISGCTNRAIHRNISNDKRNSVVDCGNFLIKRVPGTSPEVNFTFYVNTCYDGFKIENSIITIRDHTKSLVGEYKTDGNGVLKLSLKLGIYSFECKKFPNRSIITSTSLYQPGQYNITFSLSKGDELVD